eukprot:scaffold211345_cov23-Tisochrysis_lutea.AAC.1
MMSQCDRFCGLVWRRKLAMVVVEAGVGCGRRCGAGVGRQCRAGGSGSGGGGDGDGDSGGCSRPAQEELMGCDKAAWAILAGPEGAESAKRRSRMCV